MLSFPHTTSTFKLTVAVVFYTTQDLAHQHSFIDEEELRRKPPHPSEDLLASNGCWGMGDIFLSGVTTGKVALLQLMTPLHPSPLLMQAS